MTARAGSMRFSTVSGAPLASASHPRRAPRAARLGYRAARAEEPQPRLAKAVDQRSLNWAAGAGRGLRSGFGMCVSRGLRRQSRPVITSIAL